MVEDTVEELLFPLTPIIGLLRITTNIYDKSNSSAISATCLLENYLTPEFNSTRVLIGEIVAAKFKEFGNDSTRLKDWATQVKNGFSTLKTRNDQVPVLENGKPRFQASGPGFNLDVAEVQMIIVALSLMISGFALGLQHLFASRSRDISDAAALVRDGELEKLTKDCGTKEQEIASIHATFLRNALGEERSTFKECSRDLENAMKRLGRVQAELEQTRDGQTFLQMIANGIAGSTRECSAENLNQLVFLTYKAQQSSLIENLKARENKALAVLRNTCERAREALLTATEAPTSEPIIDIRIIIGALVAVGAGVSFYVYLQRKQRLGEPLFGDLSGEKLQEAIEEHAAEQRRTLLEGAALRDRAASARRTKKRKGGLTIGGLRARARASKIEPYVQGDTSDSGDSSGSSEDSSEDSSDSGDDVIEIDHTLREGRGVTSDVLAYLAEAGARISRLLHCSRRGADKKKPPRGLSRRNLRLRKRRLSDTQRPVPTIRI
jgi:hypothetical protein